MKKENFTVRLIFTLLGTFIMAFGVALSIRSLLGTTPISSVPYVYNFIIPKISIGTFSILLNLLFVIFQAIILKKKFKSYQLLQIPLVLIFGGFIDVHLYLTSDLIPSNYIFMWVLCIVSCFVIAFGIFLQVKANISFLPGEGLIMAISQTFKKEFGITKIAFDSLLVVISIISIFIFLDKFEGVREGTIASALLVGFIVQYYQKNIEFVDKLVEPSKSVKEFVPEPYMNTENFVITISREYGSGGHAVGELIAQKLGIKFYDSSLIDLTAEASGFTPEFVKEHEQKLSNKFLYQFYRQNYAFVNEAIPPQDMIFLVQTKVIRDIAAKESCVIVGRSANYILKGHPNCFNVFVHANKAFRINRVITDYGANPEDAEREMEKKDKERMNYSKHYTGRDWADLKDYDLTIESSLFGIDITAAMIIDARRKALYTRNTSDA
ncbi:MAG: cytidylate kinase family protein [Porphyromonadaceae bacterium]|nr:cytidylate kinase family protein [Porphyromonadaceae bacterium]